MTPVEALIQAALTAPSDRRESALQVLLGRADVKDAVAPLKPEPYLSLRGPSRALGVSTTTLARWRVPSHDLGGWPRYRVSEVERYLESDAFKRRAAALRAERRASKATPSMPVAVVAKPDHAIDLKRSRAEQSPSLCA